MLSVGQLIYEDNPFKLILKVDDEIGRYYRSLIPKSMHARVPRYPSHITVIRNEIPVHLEKWKLHAGSDITFEYDNYIHCSSNYIWLNVVSNSLEKIRLELGLPNASEFTKPPNGKKYFHITIANTKNLY